MRRDMALVFESLAEALRAKELIDAAGKPKYWVTFIDRVDHDDVPPLDVQSPVIYSAGRTAALIVVK
jgi:hypothetical protein